jgi:uncharacterized protein (DUF1778 family)
MTKTTQFWFRLEPKDKRLIERAAKIERRSTSDFIRLAAIDKANEIIAAEKMSEKGI